MKKTNLGEVKERTQSVSFFKARILSSSEPTLQPNWEVDMMQAWVDKSKDRFVVKTGIVTKYGFLNVEKKATFKSLEEANNFSKLRNYVFKKCKELTISACLVLAFSTSALAFTTEASYFTYASCIREGTSGIMANGRILNDNSFICASWDYAFGTRLLIRNLANNKTVEVVVSDRGPAKRLYKKGRKIDLSLAAFNRIASAKQGLVQVEVEVIK